MKLNKKTVIIIAAVVVILGLVFIFGGEGVRNAMMGVITELAGGNDTPGVPDVNDATPSSAVADNDPTDTPTPVPASGTTDTPAQSTYKAYYFRNQTLLEQHFEKHGKPEMGFKTAKEYEKAASDVVNNPDALHKTEKEDGDDVYYVEATNEFVVVSTDGYIRTYFLPSAGKSYYDRQ